MDINTLRSVITLISLAAFLGILAWSFSRRRAHAFDEAAMLPLMDDASTDGAVQSLEKGARS
jgi:cytochrome c oxidase cbb3-type subunit 4